MERGLVPPEEFITIETGRQEVVTKHFKNPASVRAFYEGKTQYKVSKQASALFFCNFVIKPTTMQNYALFTSVLFTACL